MIKRNERRLAPVVQHKPISATLKNSIYSVLEQVFLRRANVRDADLPPEGVKRLSARLKPQEDSYQMSRVSHSYFFRISLREIPAEWYIEVHC